LVIVSDTIKSASHYTLWKQCVYVAAYTIPRCCYCAGLSTCQTSTLTTYFSTLESSPTIL